MDKYQLTEDEDKVLAELNDSLGIDHYEVVYVDGERVVKGVTDWGDNFEIRGGVPYVEGEED